MQANRSRDTGPEMALRKSLHAMGFRYRASARPLKSLRRTADLACRPVKVAVFVDGCFWHSCPPHGTLLATNSDHWVPKFARNSERDRETDQTLADAGWLSIRVWEHEDMVRAGRRIGALVRERRRELSVRS